MNAPFSPGRSADQWRIGIVETMVESATGLEIVFLGGESATLGNELAEQAIKPWFSFSLRSRCPIVFLVDADNRVTKVAAIERGTVYEVFEHPRLAEVLNVRFDGELATPHTLSKQDPRYPEMLTFIKQSNVLQQPIWYIIEGNSLVDVQLLPPDEDGALCAWVEHSMQGLGRK